MHTVKFFNFSEVEKFLERNQVSRLIQTETDNMNNPISIKEMKSVD